MILWARLVALLASLRRRLTLGAIPPSGYYFASSGEFGHFFSDIPSEHRLAHVNLEWFSQAEHERIAIEAQARRLQVVYQAHEIAFVRVDKQYHLRSDWKARWTAQLPKVEAFRTRGVLHSVYVADEPYSRGLTLGEMTTVHDWLRSKGLPTMVVEVMGGQGRQPRPAYTYFGLTPYVPGPTGAWYTDWLEVEEQSRLCKANVVVGQAFNSPGFGLPDPRDAVQCARRIGAKALLWFLWPAQNNGAAAHPDYVERVRLLAGGKVGRRTN